MRDRDYLILSGYLSEDDAETLPSDVVGAIREYYEED